MYSSPYLKSFGSLGFPSEYIRRIVLPVQLHLALYRFNEVYSSSFADKQNSEPHIPDFLADALPVLLIARKLVGILIPNPPE
jgi:hypothetical protein